MSAPTVDRAPFGTLPDGRPVEAFTLTLPAATAPDAAVRDAAAPDATARESTPRARVRLLTLGGILQACEVPDRHGRLADVTLGYDTLDGYLSDRAYLGALVGRFANRIAGARFTLDGVVHQVPANDGANALHGGPAGFHRAVWEATPFARDARDGAAPAVGVTLRHASPDGDMGFPGALDVRVTYTLQADGDAVVLAVDYEATTSRATPVSLTQHAYWHLAGHPARWPLAPDAAPKAMPDAMGHELTVAAGRYLPVDAALIPTGTLAPVDDTPFDFRTPHALAARIAAPDTQLALGAGYDHCFALDATAGATVGSPMDGIPTDGSPPFAARLRDRASGRTLEVRTTEPGLQLYSGNWLDGAPVGKGGVRYGRRSGVALETQRFPDAPNQPAFPSAVLRPGQVHRSRTEFRFSAG